MTITAKGWVTAHFDEVDETAWYVVDADGYVAGPEVDHEVAWDVAKTHELWDEAGVTVIRAGSEDNAVKRSRFFFA